MTDVIDGTSGINTPGVVNTAAETIETTLAVTGVTTFAAGAAALPAITTTGDTNTGIFFPAADTIAFAEGGAEAVRIDSSGNVGIGTSSPTASSSNKTFTINAPATFTSLIDLKTNETTNLRVFGGASNSGLSVKTATPLLFDTNDIERMRIDSSGNLLVGTTADPNSSVSGVKICNPGTVARSRWSCGTTTTGVNMIAFCNGNGDVGTISVSGSATTYATSSDYRLKNTISPMTGALAKVALLKPCTYKWNVDGSDGQGFIAHELQEVVEGCVTGEKDAVDAEGNPQYQGIDTSFLVATLTAAIQEQQALITALTTRITALEAA